MFETPIILFVEDDRDLIRGIKLRFDADGFLTRVADDVETGLHIASTCQPNAIVMDVKFQDGCGLNALVNLKQNPDTKNIPVIMLSASVGSEQDAIDNGARFFIRKPCRGRQVVEAVRAAIRESNSTPKQEEVAR